MFGKVTPVVKSILIINIGIHLLGTFLPLPLNDWFGLRVVFSENFAPYQFLTYMWLHSHGSFLHLFGNMFGVFIFGPMLESVWGAKRFLTFYLICGIGAGILFGVADFIEKFPLKQDTEAFLANPTPEGFESFIIDHKNAYFKREVLGELASKYFNNENSQELINLAKGTVRETYNIFIKRGNMVGASGALYGILFAFAFLFPNTELLLLFPPIPVKAKYLVFFYGMYELYAEFNRMAGDNVAHFAHLGGMLIAFLLLKKWQRDTRRFY